MARQIQERTRGSVKIDIFPTGQLGKGERELIEGLQIGTIDLVVTSTGPMGGFVPQMLLVDLLFLFRDNSHVDKVLDGPIGEGLLNDLAKSGINGKRKAMGGLMFLVFFLSFTPSPFPQFAEEIKQTLGWF